MVVNSPLSQRQNQVWAMLGSGLTVSEVASNLKKTFQYVNQTKRTAEAKLSDALIRAGETSNLQIKRVLPKEGILWGFHPGLGLDTFVTYTSKHGMRVWYWYDDPEEVTDERFLFETRNYLLNLAEERRIQLDENEKQLHPALFAKHIFSRLIPEASN
jgi:hypothetical protein